MNYQEIKHLILTDLQYASARIKRDNEDPYMSMYIAGNNFFEELARHKILQSLLWIDETEDDEATKIHWFKNSLSQQYRESKQNVNRPGRQAIQALLLEQVQKVTSFYHRRFFNSEIETVKP